MKKIKSSRVSSGILTSGLESGIIWGLFSVCTCVCLPLRQTKKSVVIYEDRKKTLNDQETLCVTDGGVCVRVKFRRYRGKNLLWKVFFFLYILCQLKESMPGLRRRCINSGSIRGIGVHTSWSFCRRNYRRRSRCILPSPISLEHKRKEGDYKHVQCNMSLAHLYP